MALAPSFVPFRHLAAGLAITVATLTASTAQANDQLTRELNALLGGAGGDENKAWTGLLDAYLGMSECPIEVGPDFGQVDIWPGMEEWPELSDWAASNQAVVKALQAAAEKTIIGLPYGADSVPSKYRDARLVADVSIESDGDVTIEFPYLRAFETFAAFAAADMYRNFEAGDWQAGFDVAIANARVLRHLCDRHMLVEKASAMLMLAESMSVIRDAMWSYVDKIPTDYYKTFARDELPFLRLSGASDAERLRRLEMPEGDRLVVRAVLAEVFGDSAAPDPGRLGEVFGAMQSDSEELSRFGATKRWERIASVHGSLEASQAKLVDVYDDWWRRWRVRPYDPMLDLPTQFSVLNEVRYAIIAESIADLEDLFEMRKRLIVEINGTIIGAGLAGYRAETGNWPRDVDNAYTRHFPKRFDFDPFDEEYGHFLQKYLGDRRQPVDTDYGRISVDGLVIYARGRDLEDSKLSEATLDGLTGDMIVWPPLRALGRDQGLLD